MNTTTAVNDRSFIAATFNLRAIQFPDLRSKWAGRCELISSLISETGASVIGVQEMLPQMKHDLKRKLQNYSFIGCGRSYKKKRGTIGGEHTDILARNGMAKCKSTETFWLSKDPQKPGSRLLFSLFPRICTVAELEIGCTDGTGSTVRVYNTHLDHISRSVRKFQIGVILTHMELMQKLAPLPTVLMGDFNTTPSSDELKLITENTQVPLRCAYTGDEYSFKYPMVLGTRLFDYIFVSDDITVNSAYIDTQRYHGSDHYPVIASLSLKPAGENNHE